MDPIFYSQMVAALAALAGTSSDYRFDQNETGHIYKALEHVKSTLFEVKYSALKAREFIPPPMDGQADAGADEIIYYVWDKVGMAKLIANYADDLPSVDAFAREVRSPVHSAGNFFSYSRQDLRRMAKSGSGLITRKAMGARRAAEQLVDQIAALGDAASGLPGMVKNANVPVLSATGLWSGLTHAQILADLHRAVSTVHEQSEGVHSANRLLLSIERYNFIAHEKLSGATDATILENFVKGSPYIQSMADVRPWSRLKTADASNTGPRMVAYEADPMNLSLEEPMPFDVLPPQADGHKFKVFTEVRVGGCIVYYPLSMTYMDGI